MKKVTLILSVAVIGFGGQLGAQQKEVVNLPGAAAPGPNSNLSNAIKVGKMME